MTADGIRKYLQYLNDSVSSLVDKLEAAETVEEIMELKKQILITWLEFLPLVPCACYFCNLHALCDSCEYAEFHGPCTDYDSDFGVIEYALEKLMDVISDRYYKGEQYDEATKAQEATT